MTFGGSLGLGTVWIRHQISVTAKANRALLAEIGEVNRRSDDIEALIRSEQRPELLRQLNLDFRIGLVPMNEVPVVQVTENVTQRMVERATRWTSPVSAETPPLRLTLAQR
jgi:hypothetical protein